MTVAEFYQNVADNNITEEVIEKAAELLEKHQAANAKRAAKAAEKREGDTAFLEQAMAYLTHEYQTLTDIANQFAADGVDVNGKAVTPQKISHAFAKAPEGAIEKGKVKVDKRDLTGYRLAVAE